MPRWLEGQTSIHDGQTDIQGCQSVTERKKMKKDQNVRVKRSDAVTVLR